jgi:hypothetical protein
VDALVVIVDGADAMRKAVREELRRGASPTDPLDRS